MSYFSVSYNYAVMIETGGLGEVDYYYNTDRHEHQELGPGPEEQEITTAWDGCVKNPQHPNFIPFQDFDKEHLPPGWQGDDILEFIQAMGALTVRVRVKATSSAGPNGEVDYKPPRTGTGFVWRVDKITGSCPCRRCKKGQCYKPQNAWETSIKTAQHVVFDNKEAEHTVVDVGYDTESSHRDNAVRTMDGIDEHKPNADHDYCIFKTVTHDEDLARELSDQVRRWRGIRERLVETDWVGKPDTVVIVSHPHGKHKHVTVGGLREVRDCGGVVKQYRYDADTCAGSSGARVWRLRRLLGGQRGLWAHHCVGGEVEHGNGGFWWLH